MHSHDLAHLAAIVALHGEQLTDAQPATMNQMLTIYWRASRCRLDRWCHSLHAISERGRSARLPSPHPTSENIADATTQWSTGADAVVEEILVSEILTRVLAALTSAHDDHHALAESAPIGRNIFDGHLDARRRALALVASPIHRGTEYAKSIVRLHRQCDRWTDLLLAYLTPLAKVEQFAASPARIRDFEYDARHHLLSAMSGKMAGTMILAGMNSSLQRLSPDRSPNSDLNFELASAVMSCFPPEIFDSFGLLRSNRLEQLQSSPGDTEAMIEDWWQTAPSSLPPTGTRWRR
jgi:hypothetical protein